MSINALLSSNADICCENISALVVKAWVVLKTIQYQV
jgi:hypothetical protein